VSTSGKQKAVWPGNGGDRASAPPSLSPRSLRGETTGGSWQDSEIPSSAAPVVHSRARPDRGVLVVAPVALAAGIAVALLLTAQPRHPANVSAGAPPPSAAAPREPTVVAARDESEAASDQRQSSDHPAPALPASAHPAESQDSPIEQPPRKRARAASDRTASALGKVPVLIRPKGQRQR
jgi:hypothetical protein